MPQELIQDHGTAAQHTENFTYPVQSSRFQHLAKAKEKMYYGMAREAAHGLVQKLGRSSRPLKQQLPNVQLQTQSSKPHPEATPNSCNTSTTARPREKNTIQQRRRRSTVIEGCCCHGQEVSRRRCHGCTLETEREMVV
ncbi:hypothetical protein LR48_Vigan352s000200 [Vigna angularis]|uniref:Uncharacterized protein n=1 Tax=Phaseolus angularis TaxID=3914 RepID=A0A0L9T8V9_PHAAN|nr:hypothetical protein LR48_Vigan352s000200 [Vigna angularis]